MKKKDYSNELKTYRKAKKLNQCDLALQLGVTQPTIVNWENGKEISKTALLLLSHDLLWMHIIYDMN